MTERHPNLWWEFFTWGRKNVCHHQPVIMGFSTEDPKFKTNIDLERRAAGLRFWRWLQNVTSQT
jgi:hypothetical protein